jgi:hypothetical protein
MKRIESACRRWAAIGDRRLAWVASNWRRLVADFWCAALMFLLFGLSLWLNDGEGYGTIFVGFMMAVIVAYEIVLSIVKRQVEGLVIDMDSRLNFLLRLDGALKEGNMVITLNGKVYMPLSQQDLSLTKEDGPPQQT